MKSEHTHLADHVLLSNYHADQNNYWLGILLERYTLLLFGVCMKYLKNEEEAKDAVQQIFLKTITELRKYKVEYFKSWLYAVARNYCLMKLRDLHGQVIEIKDELSIAEEDNSLQRLEKDKQLELMSLSLSELHHQQRECLTLFYLRKHSYQEISDTTGYSLTQVKSFIQNGKRNLKNLLEKKIRSEH